MKYSSDDDGKIYQQKPTYSKSSQFKPKGWTDTVLGYINEAKRLTLCILSNRDLMGRPYTSAVHINVSEELSPEQHADLWATACRKLRRKGVVALWVREPNKANRVHYHLLVKNAISKKALEQAIEEAMPDRKQVKWRKRVEAIKNEWYYAHYISKAKVAGHVKGKRVDDLYSKKRLLFKANLDMKKYGTIGDFWERGKTKKTLWQQIKDRERRIGEGLEDWSIRRLAKHVHDMLDGDVPLREIERSFGYWHDEPAVREWADRLMAEDPDGY
jgi:hypothetical protein